MLIVLFMCSFRLSRLFSMRMAQLHISHLLYFLETVYLFTADDFKSIVIPKTVCGVVLAGTLFQEPRSVVEIILQAPRVCLWVWINLLLFTVLNQSQAGAIKEDSKNKPWRPIPAGRLTLSHAQRLIKVLFPMTVGVSLMLGGLYPCLGIHMLSYWYNIRGGGDTWVFRNFINAGGYLSFIAGAIQVAMSSQTIEYNNTAIKWFALITMIISTTMHTQDLYDQEGDKLRGRKTIPLVFGDVHARYSIAGPVLAWSIFAPAFWGLNLLGFIPPVTMGVIVAMRLLDKSKRGVRDDKRTFKFWNIWIISLYLLPLSARLLEGMEKES